jgi:hypothetical protein
MLALEDTALPESSSMRSVALSPRVGPTSADDIALKVITSDGRTGDGHEFHMSEALLHATLHSDGSTLSIWAVEPALPSGSYDPGTGAASRRFSVTTG